MSGIGTFAGVALDPELARALKRLAGRAQEAVQKRDDAIVEARRSGASLREIGEATGINYVTVMRLIEKYETPEERAARLERDKRKNAIKRDRERQAREARQQDQP